MVLTFGAYGSGAAPKIVGSLDKSATGDWAVYNVTGSSTQAVTKLSLPNGVAFIDLGATINIAQYPIGSKVTICSKAHTSECAVGYIKCCWSRRNV